MQYSEKTLLQERLQRHSVHAGRGIYAPTWQFLIELSVLESQKATLQVPA
jgi:hypothetical protein